MSTRSVPCPVRLTGRGVLLRRVLLMWHWWVLRPARLRPRGLRPARLRPRARGVRRGLVLVARPCRRGSGGSAMRMWRPRRLLLRRRLPVLVLAGIVVGRGVRGWLRRVGAGPTRPQVGGRHCRRRWQRLVGCFWRCSLTCKAQQGFFKIHRTHNCHKALYAQN